jgi:hypothetical protein
MLGTQGYVTSISSLRQQWLQESASMLRMYAIRMYAQELSYFMLYHYEAVADYAVSCIYIIRVIPATRSHLKSACLPTQVARYSIMHYQ